MTDPSVDWRNDGSQQALCAGLEEASRVLAEAQGRHALEFWHEKVLTGLNQTALFSYQNLLSAWRQKGLSATAWAARNLLETRIWTEYVTVSKGNARRFYLDWLNDSRELLDKACSYGGSIDPEQWRVTSPYADLDFGEATAQTARDWLGDLRSSSELVDEDYLRVSSIAKELGHAARFASLNKLLSKYVHPTAFSVLSTPSDGSRYNSATFMLVEGSTECARCLTFLNDFLKRENLGMVF
jgi:hypothetical protein